MLHSGSCSSCIEIIVGPASSSVSELESFSIPLSRLPTTHSPVLRSPCICCFSERPVRQVHGPLNPKTLTAGILEVAKAARLLSDIAAVDGEVDLRGVDVVDADAQFVADASAQVRSQAEVSTLAFSCCIA